MVLFYPTRKIQGKTEHTWHKLNLT